LAFFVFLGDKHDIFFCLVVCLSLVIAKVYRERRHLACRV